MLDFHSIYVDTVGANDWHIIAVRTSDLIHPQASIVGIVHSTHLIVNCVAAD